MKKYFLLLCFVSTSLFAWAQDADALLLELTTKLNKVKDYTADAVISSDIPMVKILPSKATVYFKQKDKFKIDAKGIAIVPKQGFTDISKLLANKSSYSAMSMPKETFSGVPVEVVSIFPASDTSDLILAKLWIDPVRDLILKSQMTTRSSGMVTAVYTYGAQVKWGLPDRMVFTVDVKKFKIPKGVATDINKTSSREAPTDQRKTGEIKVDLSGYKINTGLSDQLFK
jgi:hypothetical protein